MKKPNIRFYKNKRMAKDKVLNRKGFRPLLSQQQTLQEENRAIIEKMEAYVAEKN